MDDIAYPTPGREMFRKSYASPEEKVLMEERRLVPILDQGKFLNGIEYPESGGIFVHLVGHLYPTKGFQNPEAVAANNLVKRLFVGYAGSFATKEVMMCLSLLVFFPWKRKLKVMEKMLHGFCALGALILGRYMWQDPKRYIFFCQELRTLLFQFFRNLGISEGVAGESADVFATMIEWDDAYRYRLEDLFSETTSVDLQKNPRKEVQKLMLLARQRDPNPLTSSKFINIGRLLSTLLLHPKIKKAFTRAIRSIDFTKLQFDDADRYHVMPLGRYQFFGEKLETRFKRWENMHPKNAKGEPILPPMVEVGGKQEINQQPMIELNQEQISQLSLNERVDRASKEIEVILTKYGIRFYPVATLTPGGLDMGMKFADAKVAEVPVEQKAEELSTPQA